MRKIHFIGDLAPWKWKVSKNGTVVIIPPGPLKKKITVYADKITRRDYERGLWKKTDDCAVTPSMVREYIENNLRGSYENP